MVREALPLWNTIRAASFILFEGIGPALSLPFTAVHPLEAGTMTLIPVTSTKCGDIHKWFSIH